MKHDEAKCPKCGWGYNASYIEQHSVCKDCNTGSYEPELEKFFPKAEGVSIIILGEN